MKPYSKELNMRVLADVDTGTPGEQVAETFSVSLPTLKRWVKGRWESGEVELEPLPGRRLPGKGGQGLR
jgi:transposase